MTYGCIAEHLSHSFSALIHARLADYTYELCELTPCEVGSFLRQRAFRAINVTIPYKQTVIPFLDEIDDVARRIGAVNTIVNRDGRLYGYNTDFAGMCALIERMGLTLRGKYYEYAPDAPIELMIHGYRGNAERDLNGGVFRCAALGHSALLVDHRASGASDGKVITFGVKEAEDCLLWINLVRRRFGDDVKIFLGGVSMGAATVMMASGKELPSNVQGILADCGYSSAEKIIRKVVRDMGLPHRLLYPFIRLGARLYGGFDLNATPPVEAVAHSRVPMMFLHGDTDEFVPCDMTRECFDACNAPKAFAVIKGAGHGLAYPVDREGYVEAVRKFYGEQGIL